jgi:hypothetical protein
MASDERFTSSLPPSARVRFGVDGAAAGPAAQSDHLAAHVLDEWSSLNANDRRRRWRDRRQDHSPQRRLVCGRDPKPRPRNARSAMTICTQRGQRFAYPPNICTNSEP